MDNDILKFVPFSSVINPSFWDKFTQLKIDVLKHSDECLNIFGCYTTPERHSNKSFFEVNSTSFNSDIHFPSGYITVSGCFFNENTIEAFKSRNKNELIDSTGARIYEDICSGRILEDPSRLNSFVIISFADLKRYQYIYWFCFPSLNNFNIRLNLTSSIDPSHNISLERLLDDFKRLAPNDKSFFVLSKTDGKCIALRDSDLINIEKDPYYFVFLDSTNDEHNPGWILRNYILFIWKTCKSLRGMCVDFIALRLSRSPSVNFESSVVFNITLPVKIKVKTDSSPDGDGWIGWERNDKGQLGPRMANLKSTLDPKSLIESSADLNIKLMKWRMVAEIDLDKIKSSKCLLLGSGTLGCAVGSTLLGWGVRHISFVDNAHVSYSNPARQHLFSFDDCVANRPKAHAAADALKRNLPYINTKGYQFTIPMPGHPVGDSLIEQVRKDVADLVNLIKSHDVIFLLMDSRESRWLPSVIALNEGKVVINAALGFDTYLVMRHGSKKPDQVGDQSSEFAAPEGYKMIEGHELGCYFCNDVTAPGNSQKDRTLDQQCTVTRPGVALIAGALACELMISVLQHKNGYLAPAFYKPTNNSDSVEMFRENECLLGIVPHSVRGFLSSFGQMTPATHKFQQCTCCSDAVISEYRSRGFDFILDVLNDSKFLEKLTGLSELLEQDVEVWDLSDIESEQGA